MPFIFPQAKDPRYDIISYHESSHAKWIHVPEDVRILRFSQQHLSWGQLKGCFPTSWLNS
ncbi:MAG: hypothetical protein AMS22_15705 [Thiotrichales bacterium SG8_50]|nr:MAG: hypothetical protein AMS22_15705 [Thiotrichales bacterium SG8_50]